MKHAQQTGSQSAPIRRITFVLLVMFFGVWAAVISLRLVWLQVLQHSHYVELAARQQQKTFEVAPRRGILYDRNLHELAMTVSANSIYAIPNAIPDKPAWAKILSQIVHQDPDDAYTSEAEILRRLNASKNFAWVVRKVDNETWNRVAALDLQGIYVQPEAKRFYPDKQLAAQVLGYVGTDDNGLGGIELAFDDDLHGVPGHMLTAVDARRHALSSEERDPQPGANMVLTIDQNIQFIAEKALDEVMDKTHALRGTVVVEDPHTGEILALATRPTFDPNDFRHVGHDLLTNPAVSDIYEPGSTFKLVTYSAAIDHGVAKPTDDIDCQGGKITLFGRTIHDDKSDIGIGTVTVQRALERSSDVAAVKLALRLGPSVFYGYMKGFGFGDRTGVELPAETRGLLRPVQHWGATSIGSLAMGQEVGVTPIQLAAMVSTIANGGTYLPPRILKSESNGDAAKLTAQPYVLRNTVPTPLPEGARRVISEMSAAQMRQMMEGVVLNGTGAAAKLNGYSSGGKTGTAQKIDVVTHTYSKTKHIASFVGIAPVSNPAITVAVVVDSPEGPSYYGAAVSAPIFREIAQQTLEYLGIPYDREPQTKTVAPEAGKVQIADESVDNLADLNSLMEAVNDLPKDDPLRAAQDAAAAAPKAEVAANAPVKGAAAVPGAATQSAAVTSGARVSAVAAAPSSGPATVAVGQVKVPEFKGRPLRSAVETAESAGLRIAALGSGTAIAQAPPAGASVAPGTEVVVRFAR
jgi:cell division protein FtsI (penicillin-binding protein 3)